MLTAIDTLPCFSLGDAGSIRPGVNVASSTSKSAYVAFSHAKNRSKVLLSAESVDAGRDASEKQKYSSHSFLHRKSTWPTTSSRECGQDSETGLG